MVEFRYRGRHISQVDILYIRALVERHPNESRRMLSTRLCEAWQWRQANGALRDMVCRGMLLMLERAGQITLPPVSYIRHNPLAKRTPPPPAQVDSTVIEDRLRKLQPLQFEQVRRTAQEPLFNSLMEEHHYLGYEQPVGEHLKYLVWAQGRPVACVAWSSAPRHIGARDRYIGWSAEARRRNIRFIAYNTRFLILPWVRVEHLASHILGRMVARVSEDWQGISLLSAQDFRATISGQVTDGSKASIAGAVVRAVHADTNEVTQTVTNSDGYYTLAFLNPGKYRIEVTARAFKLSRRDDVVLLVAQKSRPSLRPRTRPGLHRNYRQRRPGHRQRRRFRRLELRYGPDLRVSAQRTPGLHADGIGHRRPLHAGAVRGQWLLRHARLGR
jgi:hypothetical protein